MQTVWTNQPHSPAKPTRLQASLKPWGGLSAVWIFVAGLLVSQATFAAAGQYWDSAMLERKLRIMGVKDLPDHKDCDLYLMLKPQMEEAEATGARFDGEELVYAHHERISFDGQVIEKHANAPIPSLKALIAGKVLSLGEGVGGFVPFLNRQGGHAVGVDMNYDPANADNPRHLVLSNFPELLIGDAREPAKTVGIDPPYDFVVGMCVHCQMDCAADGIQIFREANKLLKSGGQGIFSYCSNNPGNGTYVTNPKYGNDLKKLAAEGIYAEVYRAVFRFYSDPSNKIYYNIVTFKKR